MDDDAAEIAFRDQAGEGLLAEPRLIRFQTGRRRAFWKNNCVAIGLAAGFLEPLESTSLHMIQTAIMRLLSLFPNRKSDPHRTHEYNRQTQEEYERVRDFLLLHYAMTGRQDSRMWRHYSNLSLPESLRERIELFRAEGYLLEPHGDLFLNDSWLSVLLGQGVMPDRVLPMAALRRPTDAKAKFDELDALFERVSMAVPEHRDYLNQYAPAPETR